MKKLLRWSKDGDHWIGRTTSSLYSNCHLSYVCAEFNAKTDQRYFGIFDTQKLRGKRRRSFRLSGTVRKLADGKALCELHAQQQLGPPQ